MTITVPTFYGGYKSMMWTGITQLGVLDKRFLRIMTYEYGGILRLPAANVLPLIRGGAVFTLWNEGYHNVILQDSIGGSVGCLQGSGRVGTDPCRTNVHLIDASTAAGIWRIDCATCLDPDDTNVTDTDMDGGESTGTGTTSDPATTTTDDGGGITYDR